MLYPLLTEHKIVEPIWGGTKLAAWLALPEPHPARLGETWQVYDTNPVLNGPLAGRTLAELAREHGPALIGTRSVAHYGNDLPLLAKFIDAADRLSIQVHPDDTYAHSRESHTGFHGKTEAWYILAADPGADITYGLSRDSNRDDFAAAVANGSVEELLQRVPVNPGDIIFVPAGTIHAINAGIVLFEIQQKSDLTYRVYDYNRRDAKTGQPRELHLEKSLDVSDFRAAPHGKITPLSLAAGRELLIACPSFALERWTFTGKQCWDVDPGSFEIVTLIDGVGKLTWAGDEALTVKQGASVLLPATLGNCCLTAHESALTMLRAYVPDLDMLAAAATSAGYTDTAIAATVRK
ncbi:MAG: mannose-6-phosphate isomerase [Oscillochloris sp.]|nr:mannose-6-phosphate isomerase [Oscillochloris sp.]